MNDNICMFCGEAAAGSHVCPECGRALGILVKEIRALMKKYPNATDEELIEARAVCQFTGARL